VADAEPGLFAGAQAGNVIAKPNDAPPWIVVSHTLDDVIVGSKWPGTLWRAEVIEALQPQGHIGHYTRAISVKLNERAPVGDIFGADGARVVAVANAAHQITLAQVNRLAGLRRPDAAAHYSNAWRRWLEARGDDIHPGSYDGVLAAGRSSGSPIGQGLSVVHSQMYVRAQAIGGPGAIESDEEEDASWLAEPWSSAAATLMDAAFAYGAPDLFTPEARAVMTGPYIAVFGEMP